MGYYENYAAKHRQNKNIDNVTDINKLYKTLKALTKTANQRIVRLEQNDLKSQAYVKAEKMIEIFWATPFIKNPSSSTKVRFPLRKSFSEDEFKDAIRMTAKFLDMKTSNVRAAKKENEKRDKTLDEKFGLDTEEKRQDFYEFMSLLKDDEDNKKIPPSDIVAVLYSQNVDKSAYDFSQEMKNYLIETQYISYRDKLIAYMYEKKMNDDVFNYFKNEYSNVSDLIEHLDLYSIDILYRREINKKIGINDDDIVE